MWIIEIDRHRRARPGSPLPPALVDRLLREFADTHPWLEDFLSFVGDSKNVGKRLLECAKLDQHYQFVETTVRL